jgi:hypothetical protein
MISLESEVNRLLLLLSQKEDTCHPKKIGGYYVNKGTQVELKLKWWQKLFNWKYSVRDIRRHHSLVSTQSEISRESLNPNLKIMTWKNAASDCTLTPVSSIKDDQPTLKKGTVIPE